MQARYFIFKNISKSLTTDQPSSGKPTLLTRGEADAQRWDINELFWISICF